jgi:nucleoside phosphorylase
MVGGKVMRRSRLSVNKTQIKPAPVLLVTALGDLEDPALAEQLARIGATKLPRESGERDYRLERWSLPMRGGDRIDVLTKCLQVSGNGLAGLEVARVLRVIRPQFIISCGIGGSLSPKDAWYGSVVYSTAIHWNGFDKVETKHDGSLDFREKNIHTHNLQRKIVERLDDFRDELFSARSGIHRVQLKLASKAKADILKWLDEENIDPTRHVDLMDGLFLLHKGHIYSWDLVINSEPKRDEIYKRNSGFRCVDMESGAITYAVDNILNDTQVHATRFIAFRGISDLAASKVESPWRTYAASAAGLAAVEFIRGLTPADFVE